MDLDVDAMLMLGGVLATVILSLFSWLFHDLYVFGFTICNCFISQAFATMLH